MTIEQLKQQLIQVEINTRNNPNLYQLSGSLADKEFLETLMPELKINRPLNFILKNPLGADTYSFLNPTKYMLYNDITALSSTVNAIKLQEQKQEAKNLITEIVLPEKISVDEQVDNSYLTKIADEQKAQLAEIYGDALPVAKANETTATIAELQANQDEIKRLADIETKRQIDERSNSAGGDNAIYNEKVKVYNAVYTPEYLLRIEEEQKKHPNTVYLNGTEEELLRLQQIAKDAGVTTKLNSKLTDPTGKNIARIVTINPQYVAPTLAKNFDFLLWLYDFIY